VVGSPARRSDDHDRVLNADEYDVVELGSDRSGVGLAERTIRRRKQRGETQPDACAADRPLQVSVTAQLSQRPCNAFPSALADQNSASRSRRYAPVLLGCRDRPFDSNGLAIEIDVGPSQRADLASSRSGRGGNVEPTTQFGIGFASENEQAAYVASVARVHDNPRHLRACCVRHRVTNEPPHRTA